jgi:hypothetical protein
VLLYEWYRWLFTDYVTGANMDPMSAFQENRMGC